MNFKILTPESNKVSQKFFNVTIVFQNQNHTIGRMALESWLQFFFSTNLIGKELAESIGTKTIILHTLKPSHKAWEEAKENTRPLGTIKWWEFAFAVIKIK